MSTPICDFVRRYVGGGAVRMHMPGHKGCGPLGFEALDITEIDGADDLFHPEGIIAQSEENAGAIFGAHTLYATGGSTLCIQTMVHLLAVYARSRGQRPLLLAGRNAHKAFVNAAALLDVPVRWLCPAAGEAYYSGAVTPEQLEWELARSREPVTAVYLTCPDYLGELPDVAALATVCRRAGVLLAVDNAHGAYLKFLSPSRHPMDLGADLCCDSAHKTLPVVTGGAYLHIAHQAPELLHRQGYTADISGDGLSGLDNAASDIYDLVVLDAMLPGMDGFTLLQRLRQEGHTVPVLMLTARSGVEDRVRGLDSGADYYLTKPFEPQELLACVRLLLRRTDGQPRQEDAVTCGDLRLEPGTFLLRCGQREVRLSRREYDLMELLIRSYPQIVTKEQLILKVWGYDSDAEDNNVEVYISFLRRKLEHLHSAVKIRTHRMVGYCLEVGA